MGTQSTWGVGSCLFTNKPITARDEILCVCHLTGRGADDPSDLCSAQTWDAYLGLQELSQPKHALQSRGRNVILKWITCGSIEAPAKCTKRRVKHEVFPLKADTADNRIKMKN